MKILKKLPFLLMGFLVGPVIISAIIAISITTNENFYIKMIKSLNPIETFISARNSKLEKNIRKEIEDKTGISKLDYKVKKAQNEYETALGKYRKANRSDKYEKLKRQIDELNELKWAENSGMFKNGKDFERFRKIKIEELTSEIESLEKFRDKNEDKIEKLEDVMEDKKDIYEDLSDELTDKKDEARDIAKSKHEELPNTIMSDISKVKNELTAAFNNLFLETEIRRLIRKYIGFATHRETQVKTGYI